MADHAEKLQCVPLTTYSPLHELPLELLEWILTYLESDDLFNLRLASKELAVKTIQHMARTYFTWLHILMMDSRSMSRLVWIAKHPVYSLAVQKVELNMVILETPEEHEHGYLTRPCFRTPEKIAKYRALYASHVDFRKYVKNRLELALNLFAFARNVPSISTTLGCYTSHPSPVMPGAFGAKKLEAEHGRHVFEECDPLLDQNPHDIVCRAIYGSAAPISHLQLGHFLYRFDPWTLGQMMFEHPHWTPFKHLRDLTLFLPSHKVPPGLRGKELRRHRQFLETNRMIVLTLVSQAERLESFSLDCKGSYMDLQNMGGDTTIFQSLVKDKLPLHGKPLQHIAELDLRGHDIPKDMLLSFIRDHKATLKSLDLTDIVDGERDDLEIKHDIFASAQDILGFKLRMDSVYDVGRETTTSTDNDDSWPAWETIESWRFLNT